MGGDERAGQPDSMEQVIALYYDQIYKFCYWKTTSALMRKDITQDTFIYGHGCARRHIPTLKVQSAARYTIAHHL